MNITEAYTGLLESLGLVVSEAGHVLRPTKTQDPVQVDGKDVVLPTKYYLEKNNWEEVHAFHPLCEDALMGQSPTFHLLNTIVRIAVSQRYAALIKDILKVSTDKDLQQRIKNPDSSALLMGFHDVKAGAVKSWTSVYSTFLKGQSFSNMYVKRSVEHEGTMYQRAGNVSYPILEDDSESSLLGVKLSKKDTAGLRSLVSKVVEPVPVVFLSNSSVPYFDTLMQYWLAMAKRHNEILAMFGDVITIPKIELGKVEEMMEAIERLRKRIPRLPDNAGVKTGDVEEKRNAGTEPEDDAFANIKLPAKRKVEDTPPWEDKEPTERVSRRESKTSILDFNKRHVDDRDDDLALMERDRERNRITRSRDRGRDRDRDRGRSRPTLREDVRSRRPRGSTLRDFFNN